MFKGLQEKVLQILRWSEKYTKTDMVYLARGSALSFIGQGSSILASLLLAIVVSQYLSKEVYGEYKYVLSLVGILAIFSLNGIPSAVFQSAAQGYDGALIRGFWTNIRWSALIFIGTFFLSGYYFVMGNVTLATEILIGGMLSPFLASANLFGSFLGGKKDFYRQMTYGIIENVVPIFIFIGVVIMTNNPIVLVATYFTTNLLAALFFYRRTVAVYHASAHLHDEDMLRFSKHLSVMGIISGIAGSLDQILLFQFVGAAPLAIYAFATAIPDQIKGPWKNVDAMLQARFVNRSGLEISHGIFNKFGWSIIGCVVVTGLYIALAPTIFSVLFPKYIDAVWYSQIYALWILTLPFDVFSTYILAKKLTKELYVIYVSYSIIQIVSVLIGIIFWGLIGLILARIATRFLTGCVSFIMYRTAIARETANTR